MTITLSQLIAPASEEATLNTLVDWLADMGFQSRSWASGSVQRSTLQLFARGLAKLSESVANVAAAGYNGTAKGAWLTILAADRYEHVRGPAVATRHTVVLTCSALGGPYTKTAGSVVVSTAGGITFRITDAFTLPTSGSVAVSAEAEVPGSAGNVAPGTITVVKTAMAGVAVTNPALPASSTSITRDGCEEESDEQLRTRNSARWATLGLDTPLRYVYSCRAADPAIKRVYVDATNPYGPGTLAICIAGDSGPVSQSLLDTCAAYMRGDTDGLQKYGPYASVTFQSAAARPVVLDGSVYMLAAYNTPANQAAVLDALAAYFRDLPIGGVGVTDTAGGIVPVGDVYRTILTIQGVRNFAPATALGDTPVRRGEVAVPVFAFNFVSV